MTESPETLIQLLRIITGSLFAFGALFLLFAVFYFRRSRNDAYWRQRRQASRRGMRYAAGAFFFLVGSAAFCLITFTVTYVENRDTEQAELPQAAATHPTNTAPPIPSITSTTMAIPTAEATPTLTPPPTELPTPPGVPAGRIEITAIDDAISDDWQPIQADVRFETSAQRLYFFFTYQDVEKNTVWGQVLLRDGQVIRQHSAVWGNTPPQDDSFFFFGNQEGFAAGNYTIQITLGADKVPAASAQFIVLP